MSYSGDKTLLESNYIETIELSDSNTGSKVLLSPTLQGRVMTSTIGDGSDISFGWINHKLIASRVQKEFHNPYGGEERFWIGPEGGKFSFYFSSVENQDFNNWRVPGILDNGAFYPIEQTSTRVLLSRRFELRNAIGSEFEIEATRVVELCSREEISKAFGFDIPQDVNFVAYRTDNSLKNCGSNAWDKEYGMPCVWLLGMYVSSPEATIVMPYKGSDPKIVTDYFGPLPADRIERKEKAFYFKADGKYRSKIGLPKENATGLCACFDTSEGTFSVIKTDILGGKDYLNAVWGKQESPFGGDAVNAYNDGPTETGTQMGPFLEIETSSPGMELKPGESMTHSQYTLHLKTDAESINKIISLI